MHGIFHPDNPVVRFFVKLSYIWVLNILWLVCSLPLFTIGASTTALLYASMKLLKDEGTPERCLRWTLCTGTGRETGAR